MADLSHWDFSDFFTVSEVASLILGIEPTDRDPRVKPILDRLIEDYSRAWEFWHRGSGNDFQDIAVDNFPTRGLCSGRMVFLTNMLRKPEYAKAAIGSMKKYLGNDFYDTNSPSHFGSESFSRREISRWLNKNNMKSIYSFSEPQATVKDMEKPILTRERNTLLTIIAVLCNEAKLDFTKVAKTAGLIQSTADKMGVSIGESTIEGHLKKIPDALGTRTK